MSDRDSDVQSLFEVADDSLQGILGYYLYTLSMKDKVSEKQILDSLPERKLPITFSWDRFYSKQELTAEMRSLFEPLHSRITLVYITSTFEAFLSDLVAILYKRGFSQNLNKPICNDLERDKNISTVKLIKWAFQEALEYKNKNAEVMINRLPETFGIIDDARRLRNLIVHKKGLFHISYKKSVIKDFGIQEFYHPDYELYEKNQDLNVPIRLNRDAIIDYNKAHIEAIHILHNSIQQRIFNFPGDGYSYKDEKKPIDWGRIYRGT